MSTNIRLKRSAVPGKVPTTGALAFGELAINTFDGHVYLKKDSGTPTIVRLRDVTEDNLEVDTSTYTYSEANVLSGVLKDLDDAVKTIQDIALANADAIEAISFDQTSRIFTLETFGADEFTVDINVTDNVAVIGRSSNVVAKLTPFQQTCFRVDTQTFRTNVGYVFSRSDQPLSFTAS